MGYCFFAASSYLWSLHDSLVAKSGCTGNNGVGKLFWGIKNLSFCCFLVAIKFLNHITGECQWKCAVCFEMISREDTKLTGCN